MARTRMSATRLTSWNGISSGKADTGKPRLLSGRLSLMDTIRIGSPPPPGTHTESEALHENITGTQGSSMAKAATKNDNPKTDPKDASNQIKYPGQWTTGGEPMTGAQASYLKTLSEQTKEPEAYDPDLGKAEASKRIDALRV